MTEAVPIDTFAAIAANDDQPRCQVLDANDAPCGDPAAWWWQFHKCSSGLMCNAHYRGWWQFEAPQITLPDTCGRCEGRFTRMADVVKFVAL